MIRARTLLASLAPVLLLTACGGSGPDEGTSPVTPTPVAPPMEVTFMHVATASNTSENTTTLEHPSLNGHPEARLIVTQNWDAHYVYNPSPVGVQYSASAGRWQIFEEDLGNLDMPVGAAFTVTFAPSAFLHVVTAANHLTPFRTEMDDPRLNDHPEAVVLLTHNLTPPGATSWSNNPSPQGVYYDAGSGRWSIFNENLNTWTMDDGDAYNVLVLPPSPRAFQHTATASNIAGHTTTTSIPGRPLGMHVTHRIHVSTGFLVFNRDNVGVFTSGGGVGILEIFNEGGAPIPAGMAFHLYLP